MLCNWVFSFICYKWRSLSERWHTIFELNANLFRLHIIFIFKYFPLNLIHGGITIKLKSWRKFFFDDWDKIFMSDMIEDFLSFLIFRFDIVHLLIFLLSHCIFDQRPIIPNLRCICHPGDFGMWLNFRLIFEDFIVWRNTN